MVQGVSKQLTAPVMVGREGLLGLLGEAAADARAGRGRALLMTGEAGLGKNRLLREGVRLAAEAGCRTLPGAAFGADLALPYALLGDLLNGSFAQGEWDALVGGFGVAGTDLDLLVRAAEQAPSAHSAIDVWAHGGAVSRPGADATAYGRRDARYLVNPEANWTDPADDAANLAWARGCLSALREYAAGGAYLNPGFGEEGDALTRSAYGDNLARLRALKTRYDPHNVFRHNQNIRPLL